MNAYLKLSLTFALCIPLFLGCDSNTGSSQGSSDLTDDQLRQKANDLAHKYIILDGHVDIPYRLQLKMDDISKRTEDGDFDYERAKEGGLDAPFMSIYVPSQLGASDDAKTLADTLINMVNKFSIKYPDKFGLANSPNQIQENFKNGKISIPMGMENGSPILNDLGNLEYFYNRGIRYITLTHSKDNQISDASYDTTHTWKGLSPFGKQVVPEMNRLGIMIDVSHISDDSFYQVMEISQAPVIASHSSCRHFTPGFERNMSDEMIKKLAGKGGVILINFGSTFIDQESLDSWKEIDKQFKNWLHESGIDQKLPRAMKYKEQQYAKNFIFSNVEKVADHIDHVVNLVGPDHVGFGSDFDGVGNSLPVGLKDVSFYPNLIFTLLKRGYTEDDIQKICSGNAFRVWNEVIRISQEKNSKTSEESSS